MYLLAMDTMAYGKPMGCTVGRNSGHTVIDEDESGVNFVGTDANFAKIGVSSAKIGVSSAKIGANFAKIGVSFGAAGARDGIATTTTTTGILGPIIGVAITPVSHSEPAS